MLELTIISSLLGLSLGSFVNVCAYRLPRGLSVVGLRSSCPHCKKELSWFELIPVLSFIVTLGKCKRCGERISIIYPIVEILAAIIVVAAFVQNGISLRTFELLVFSLLMLTIAIIDWKHLIIPNQLVITGLITGILLKGIFGGTVLIDCLISSVISFLVLLAIMLLGNFLLKKESMGMGDVKLAAVIGLFLGLWNFLIALWFAAILGMLYVLIKSFILYLSSHNLSSQNLNKVPFGSFMAIAASIVFFFQETISELIQTWLTYIQ
jgi:leader peptidase (prepilin peptidase) / N-methyltransferase